MFDAAVLNFESPVAEAAPQRSPAHRPLLRLWLARVVAGREDAYCDFVERIARPVFEAHEGCGAVTLLIVDDSHHALLTQWSSPDDLVALQLSLRHQAMVEQLLRADLVEAVAPVSLWPMSGDVPSLAQSLRQRIARAMEQLMPLRPATTHAPARVAPTTSLFSTCRR